jgi:hypothetical protein
MTERKRMLYGNSSALEVMLIAVGNEIWNRPFSTITSNLDIDQRPSGVSYLSQSTGLFVQAQLHLKQQQPHK